MGRSSRRSRARGRRRCAREGRAALLLIQVRTEFRATDGRVLLTRGETAPGREDASTVAETIVQPAGRRTSSQLFRSRGDVERAPHPLRPRLAASEGFPTCSCSRTCTPRSSGARSRRGRPRGGRVTASWQNRAPRRRRRPLTCDGRKVDEAGREVTSSSGANAERRRPRHGHRNGELCLTRPSGCTARWRASAPSRRRREQLSSAASVSGARCTSRSARRPCAAGVCAALRGDRPHHDDAPRPRPLPRQGRAARRDVRRAAWAARPATAAAARGSMHIADPRDRATSAPTRSSARGIPIAAGAALAVAGARDATTSRSAFFGEGAVGGGRASTRRSTSPRSGSCRSCSSARTTTTPSSRPWPDLRARCATSRSRRAATASRRSASTATTSRPWSARPRDAPVARARAGDGPTLIEAHTYRWCGHYEGDPERYRSKEEVRGWARARSRSSRAAAAVGEARAAAIDAEVGAAGRRPPGRACARRPTRDRPRRRLRRSTVA